MKTKFSLLKAIEFDRLRCMNLGYARVSTSDQDLALQLDALQAANCGKVYQEVASGAKAKRPQLEQLIAQARAGDVVVVWKLDRLGRSLKDLVTLVGQLMERQIGLKSLRDPIDTTSPQGRMIFNLFATLAEFERDLLIERTQAGLKAARARGRKGGRPKGLSPSACKKAQAAAALYNEGVLSIREITDNLDVSRATLYKYLRQQGVEVKGFQKSVPKPNGLRVKLILRVENNSKHVRGKKRSIDDIESLLISRYNMKKAPESATAYELSIPGNSDAELDAEITSLLDEAASIADSRHCFIEWEVSSLDNAERRWA